MAAKIPQMKIKGSDVIYSGYSKYLVLEVETGKGKIVERELLVRRNAVAAMVYNTKAQEYVLVSQWRAGTNTAVLEIVAGVIDDDEAPETAIQREIEEETGFKTDKLTLIVSCYMSPGVSTELIHIYYCEVSGQVHAGGGLEHEDEELTIHNLDFAALQQAQFIDAKTIIAADYIIKRHNTL